MDEIFQEHLKKNFWDRTFVYFIREESDANVWKIGRAKRPELRVAELNVGNARKLTLRFTIACENDERSGPATEAWFQKYFTRRWVRGEWYWLNAQEAQQAIFDFVCYDQPFDAPIPDYNQSPIPSTITRIMNRTHLQTLLHQVEKKFDFHPSLYMPLSELQLALPQSLDPQTIMLDLPTVVHKHRISVVLTLDGINKTKKMYPREDKHKNPRYEIRKRIETIFIQGLDLNYG
jgi:hypothetical protein